LNEDSHEFSLIPVIKGGLLRTVTGGVLAGLLDEKGERSEHGDGGDVGPGFGRRQEFCVFVEESGHSFVAALAEEIGFADGLVGQRGVEGDERLAEQQSRDR